MLCTSSFLDDITVSFNWAHAVDIPQFSAGRGISSRAAEFGRCRGISVFPRNFTEFCVNTEIPRQRPTSVNLYCCSNCCTQSLETATQACWFQGRVFTFSLLTYLSFYLLDLCTWRRPVNHDISHTSHWRHVTNMMISHHYHWYHSVTDTTDQWSHQNLKPSTLI